MSIDPLLELAKKADGQVSAGLKARILVVPPQGVHVACVGVSRLPGFYHLSTITAVDEGETIALHYHFWQGQSFIDVKTLVSKTAPALPTLSDSMPSATLYEAEIQDLFGVSFTGNPYVGKRLLLPDDYPAEAPPPLRREADPEKIRKMMELE